MGLVTVMTSDDAPPKLTTLGVNALLTVGGTSTATVATALLLALLATASPPPLTLAVLVILVGASTATLTAIVMGGYTPLLASESPREHVMVCPATVQPQPEPAALSGVNPVGNTSVTVTAPTVVPVPALLAVSVKLAPVLWLR